ncbi:MAG: serine/threonine protein kinase [Myxococcales bacterium]|nr:serine/threonine protein kinase [Myxococcales bacterium]
MEAKAKVTKEVLCEEARFILANMMAESKYGRQNSYDDIRRVCEGAVSIPFTEYVGFLEKSGYLKHDLDKESLEVTSLGEDVANGSSLTELTVQAVAHFKSARRGKGRSSKKSSAPTKIPPRRERFEEPRGGDGRSAGEVLDSRYEKLASIGSGGVGTVYRARQVPLNRQVALKEIRDLFSFFAEEQRPEIVRRFTDVVRAHAELAHPNILPIHDVNLEKEFPYVVSELCPNGSVRRLISDAETIPVGLALKYLLQTLHALQAAHRERVSHRGLKPENMLIDAYGNVKVGDFGFLRVVERDQSVIRQVYVGMGTVAYMAPELFVDPTGAGPQADIYALGIIFYELLTRKLPGRRSPMPSEVDPKLPEGLDDIFDLMTRDSRSERYSTVDDILDDFNKIDGLNEVMDQQ